MPDPIRANCLNETLDPSCRKFNTDILELHFAELRIDILLPICKKSNTDPLDPCLQKDLTEIEDPKLEMCATER